MDPQGNPWVALFRTNTLVRINPNTMAVTRFKQANEASRSRRIEYHQRRDGVVRGRAARLPGAHQSPDW